MHDFDAIQAHEHLLQATNALHQAERYHLVPVKAAKYLYHAQIHIAKAGAHYAKSIDKRRDYWERSYYDLKQNPYAHVNRTDNSTTDQAEPLH